MTLADLAMPTLRDSRLDDLPVADVLVEDPAQADVGQVSELDHPGMLPQAAPNARRPLRGAWAKTGGEGGIRTPEAL